MHRLRHPLPFVSAAILSAAACGGIRTPQVTFTVPLLQTVPVGAAPARDASTEFSRLFCKTLLHLSVGEPWSYCAQYFDPALSPETTPLPDLQGTTYRVLVLPGIFGQCVESLAQPFADAHKHLWREHRIDTEYTSLAALGSAAYNAREIADYLTRNFTATDRRKYIVIGYSKGASDMLQALADHEIARTATAALVTVAGSVMGSPLADSLPQLLSALTGSRVADCAIGDGGGITSLGRKERVEAMVRFTKPQDLHLYSIAAVSSQATTSRVLQGGWRRLSVHWLENDSQMLRPDAIVPGATYLGTAKADHWAVALPFEDVPDPRIKRVLEPLIDRNAYPREALLEAVLRFVLTELP